MFRREWSEDMMKMLTITIEEAEKVLDAALQSNPIPSTSDDFSPEVRLSAIIGVISIVRGLQILGYRIIPPLKEVK